MAVTTWSPGQVLAAQDLNDTFASKLDLAGGKILQVVSTVKVNTFSESVASGGTSGAVTGLSLSITPSLATSKVLILYTVSSAAAGPVAVFIKIFKDGSLSTLIGDASGVRQRSTTATDQASDVNFQLSQSGVFMDSPATTSAITYDIRLGHSSSVTRNVYVNRADSTSSQNYFSTTASSLTLMEVSA